MAKPPVDDERQLSRQSVGERLRCVREAKGYSQRQVAEALGLTPLSVIHYEAGRTPFPTDLLPALDALGLNGAWVATGIPSVDNDETRERFAAVLAWVRREAAIHDLDLSPSREVDIAWYAFRRLDQGLAQDALSEQAIVDAVHETFAETLGAGG